MLFKENKVEAFLKPYCAQNEKIEEEYMFENEEELIEMNKEELKKVNKN